MRVAAGAARCEAMTVTITVRMAQARDVPVLVRLRMANAERHAGLDPSGHRLPEAGAVRRYFEELLSGSAGDSIVVLVAEVSGTVAGMTEIVMMPAPPDHQILVPRRVAQVHTVVLERHRGNGIGKALVTAAEKHAEQRGVSRSLAPILAPNTQAISFYAQAGFGQHGLILSKELTVDDHGP